MKKRGTGKKNQDYIFYLSLQESLPESKKTSTVRRRNFHRTAAWLGQSVPQHLVSEYPMKEQ